jgi:hypothetical protein
MHRNRLVDIQQAGREVNLPIPEEYPRDLLVAAVPGSAEQPDTERELQSA